MDLDYEETCLNRAAIIRNQIPLAKVVFGEDTVVDTHLRILMVFLSFSFSIYRYKTLYSASYRLDRFGSCESVFFK